MYFKKEIDVRRIRQLTIYSLMILAVLFTSDLPVPVRAAATAPQALVVAASTTTHQAKALVAQDAASTFISHISQTSVPTAGKKAQPTATPVPTQPVSTGSVPFQTTIH